MPSLPSKLSHRASHVCIIYKQYLPGRSGAHIQGRGETKCSDVIQGLEVQQYSSNDKPYEVEVLLNALGCCTGQGFAVGRQLGRVQDDEIPELPRSCCFSHVHRHVSALKAAQ